VNKTLSFVASLAWSVAAVGAAQPLRIDLTPAPVPLPTGHLGLGATSAPGGRSLSADSQSLFRDGQPFIPVMGEMHFTRYPAEEWRDALLKMKAGGIDIVATYVFWIHHQEEPGQWDWSGRRSLRDFLKLCKELDLLVLVRLGPWAHGEVRNGGFPDWVQHADFWPDKSAWKNRGTHPEFMRLTTALYQQIATQMQGSLWKDGGPVIGVQHDNECGNLPYLIALKKLARDCGIDVPFYTMTGWNGVPIPDEGLLPLFGGYADGFWMDDPTGMRKAFLFTPIRDNGDMGAINGRLTNIRPERNAKIQRFPYLCCEIGGGMPSSYRNRIHVTPAEVASLALIKLGEGNNLPGYYMYQGGVNPDAKLTTLNESKATGYPNDLPVKDYDFGPLSAAGLAREHYFLLRQQHLFLRDFGPDLARMSASFPEQQPVTLDDTATVRWNVRSDGERGFLFFNNHQRYQQLPAKEGVQFSLGLKQGEQIIPRRPVTLPSGAYGFWPVNLDCAGVRLDYATAQPLCRLEANGEHWYFFTALEGIAPELALAGTEPIQVKAGTRVALSRVSPGGGQVHFIVLPPEQGRQLWKLSLAGRERVVLSPNTLLPETRGQLTLEVLGPASPGLAVFPPVTEVRVAGSALMAERDGIFQRFSFTSPAPEMTVAHCDPVRSAAAIPTTLSAMDESAWTHAAVWRIRVPQAVAVRESLLRLHYVGDVARIYGAGKLVLDNFYNGQPFDIPLWRLTPAELASLEIHIMPLKPGQPGRLPDAAADEAKSGTATPQVKAAEILRQRRIPLVFTGENPGIPGEGPSELK
jgi:beta-galactosidase